jgi:hypothetical protein
MQMLDMFRGPVFDCARDITEEDKKIDYASIIVQQQLVLRLVRLRNYTRRNRSIKVDKKKSAPILKKNKI